MPLITPSSWLFLSPWIPFPGHVGPAPSLLRSWALWSSGKSAFYLCYFSAPGGVCCQQSTREWPVAGVGGGVGESCPFSVLYLTGVVLAIWTCLVNICRVNEHPGKSAMGACELHPWNGNLHVLNIGMSSRTLFLTSHASERASTGCWKDGLLSIGSAGCWLHLGNLTEVILLWARQSFQLGSSRWTESPVTSSC